MRRSDSHPPPRRPSARARRCRSALRAAALAAALGASSCYAVHYRVGPRDRGGSERVEKAHFFLWGLAGSKDVDLDALCPRGPLAWQSEATFTDGLLAILTLGIYAPRTVQVQCAD